ncbi:MAG: branched-chain amino acid ABC transporter permease [Oscillospiraceae bacterium]|nr:branched-chain amino acid ABC transporter permease [Oscillospiraceae bacterium]
MTKIISRYLNFKNLCVLVGLILFTVLIPNNLDVYMMTVINAGLAYFIGALGISLMLGMGGQMSFAAISFMGLGAFITARFSKFMGMNTVLSMLLSTLIVVAASGILGLLLFRLSGAYFTFATIGLVQITSNVLTTYRPFTGGPDGISGIPRLSFWGIRFDNLYVWFYLLLASCIVCGFIVQRIRNSALGRSLASVRDNEVAAQTLGVNCYKVKIISFMIAGAFAAVSGSFIAYLNSSISASLFTFQTSSTFVVMVMLGGVNSTVGTFVGTVLITLLPEWMRPLTLYMRFIYGVAIILMMIYMPMGLAGIFNTLYERLRSLFRRRLSNGDNP